jgi:hypothetical protein
LEMIADGRIETRVLAQASRTARKVTRIDESSGISSRASTQLTFLAVTKASYRALGQSVVAFDPAVDGMFGLSGSGVI